MKPEFTVQDGAIRLVRANALSSEKDTFLLNESNLALKEFPNTLRNDVLVDFSQKEYQAAEGLTAEMLTYLPGEDVLDFGTCSQEHLAMVVEKWCAEKNRLPVESVEPHYAEFLREEKLSELHKACQDAINKGIEVATSCGMKRFSLTMQDQVNLLRLQHMLDKGCLAMPYQAGGEPMRLWSREDIQKIVQEADRHIAYHQTYFSLLCEWIRRTSYPDFLDIDYSDALLDDLAERMGEIPGVCYG